MKKTVWALAMLIGLALQAHAAATPEQKCQAARNQAAGKYAACRQKAESGLAASDDATKYGAAITKCEGKFAAGWQKATDKATAAGATCPEAPLVVTDFKTVIDAHCDNVATALGGDGLDDCPADLTPCQDSLATCASSSSTCSGNLTTCENTLTSVSAGTASAPDVVAGKTFSSSAGIAVSGTVPARSNVSGADGSLSVVLPDGFYSGSKTATANDSNLVAGSIKSGTTIFGVSGSVIEASGNALADQVLVTRTFSNASGAAAGSMPNRGAVVLTPGTSDQGIAAGFHDGSGYCAGDANLTGANIKSGSTIFGVSGSVIEASGNALVDDVLATRTFSNSSGSGSGSMPNRGAVVLTPGTSNQGIAAGFHDGSGYCVGDADLIGANIKVGTDIFGVSGTYNCGNGVIDPGEQCDQGNLNGQTCASLSNSYGELRCGTGCVFDTGSCVTCGTQPPPVVMTEMPPVLPTGKFIVRTTYGLSGVGTPTNITDLFNRNVNLFNLVTPRHAAWDASAFVDPWNCSSGDNMIYHWQVRLPSVEDYRVAGITGTDSPVLQIASNAIPVGDVTFILTVQSRSLLGTQGLQTVTVLSRISGSALTLQILDTCKYCANSCSIAAARPADGCI